MAFADDMGSCTGAHGCGDLPRRNLPGAPQLGLQRVQYPAVVCVPARGALCGAGGAGRAHRRHQEIFCTASLRGARCPLAWLPCCETLSPFLLVCSACNAAQGHLRCRRRKASLLLLPVFDSLLPRMEHTAKLVPLNCMGWDNMLLAFCPSTSTIERGCQKS